MARRLHPLQQTRSHTQTPSLHAIHRTFQTLISCIHFQQNHLPKETSSPQARTHLNSLGGMYGFESTVFLPQLGARGQSSAVACRSLEEQEVSPVQTGSPAEPQPSWTTAAASGIASISNAAACRNIFLCCHNSHSVTNLDSMRLLLCPGQVHSGFLHQKDRFHWNTNSALFRSCVNVLLR